MKILRKLLPVIVIASLFMGCASSGVNVGAHQEGEADISAFKTYNWVSDVGDIPNDQMIIGPEGVLIFNNRSTRSTIQEAIETQLEAKGFTRQVNNPDMLVNFTVLEQDDQLRTYTQGSRNFLGEGPVDQDVKMVDVEAGTILVNFINADTGNQVWQGFASGALEESDVEDEETVEAKVAAIFEKFDFSAFSLN